MTDDRLNKFSNHFYSPSDIGVIQTTIVMIIGLVFYHCATMAWPIVGSTTFPAIFYLPVPLVGFEPHSHVPLFYHGMADGRLNNIFHHFYISQYHQWGLNPHSHDYRSSILPQCYLA